jgi:GAF domain-containing protein
MQSHPIKCLIVEDQPDDAALLARSLTRSGLEITWERVETLQSAHEALHRERWDVVLADYTLPGFRGLEVLDILAESELDIPFIIVSGTIDVSTAMQAMKAGARDFVLKDRLERLAPSVQRELAAAQVRAAQAESTRFSDALNRMNAVIHSSLEAETLLQRVVSAAAEALDADEAVIAERNGDTWIVRARHGDDPSIVSQNVDGTEERLLQELIGHSGVLAIDNLESVASTGHRAVGDAGVKSAILCPLVARDEIVGYLSVGHRAPHSFTPAEIDFAEKLGWTVSSALENAELYGILRDERDLLGLVMETTDNALAYMDDELRVVMANETYAQLCGKEVEETSLAPAAEVLPPGGITLDILREVLADASERHLDAAPANGGGAALEYWDWLVRPVCQRDGAVTGLVISGTRVTEKVRDALLGKSLSEISALLARSLKPNKSLHDVLQHIGNALGSSGAAIVDQTGDGWVVHHAMGRATPLLGRLIAERNDPVLCSILEADVMVTPDPSAPTDMFLATFECVSFTGLPLRAGSDVRGVLLACFADERALSDAEKDFLARVAFALSMASENAQIYEKEHMIAETLQQSLLALPTHLNSVRFAHHYGSATDQSRVGGDFYDIFELQKGRVAIAIGDVSGKGLSAASVTALVKNVMRAHAVEGDLPSAVLRKTNGAVFRFTSVETFVTVFFGIYDRSKKTLTYANAGHPSALIADSAGTVVELKSRGPLLGALQEMVYDDDVVQLSDAQTLLLYTDGLVEARRGRDLYGEDRLIAALKKGSGDPAQLLQHVLADVLDFAGGHLSDDIAILTVAAAPSHERSRAGSFEHAPLPFE